MLMRCLFLLFSLSAVVPSAMGKNLVAYFQYNSFNVPGQTPYLETYITVIGHSVEFAPLTGTPNAQANVEITLILKQGEKISDFKKFTLASPVVEATKFVDFMDQQRFAVMNGEYELEVTMRDLNNPEADPFSAIQKIEVDFPSDKLTISSMQLLDKYSKAATDTRFTKSGYDLVPLVTGFYGEGEDELAFYGEIYNSHLKFGDDERFLINYYIETFEKENTLGNYFKFKIYNAKNVVPLLHKFNIAELGSGYYNLVVEVRNSDNQLIDVKKTFFQRQRLAQAMNVENIATTDLSQSFVLGYNSLDTLRENIYCLSPIATDSEKSIIESYADTEDITLMQKFFHSFWVNRDQNAPESAWAEYKEQVDLVQRLYGHKHKKGYQTDMGRVYLQYGAPNTITDRPNEPSAYPYQIWHFYKVGAFNNKRFVFYSPQLASQDYILLHAEIPGEPKDYRWQFTIQSRQNPNNNVDQTQGSEHYGSRVDELFTTPR